MADDLTIDPLSPGYRELMIQRTHNGWVIRPATESMRGNITPSAVSETPKGLAEMIGQWARAQALEADMAKRG